MSKQDFIDQLIKHKDALGINTTTQASKILDCFIDTLKHKLQHLQEGEYFRIYGVGSFYPLYFESRTVRNPSNGKTITVPPKKKIRFRSHIPSNLT